MSLSIAASPRRAILVTAALLFVVTLVAYLVTLSPTVNFIDSGEIITVGATAGIAHPPGYPLYTILIIAASALPFGNEAVRVNFVSALNGALATALFFLLVYEAARFHLTGVKAKTSPAPAQGRAQPARSSKRPRGGPTQSQAPAQESSAEDRARDLLALGAAVGASLLLAASQTFWNWATQAKMYTLHYAFVAALFWLALRTRRAILESRQQASPSSSAIRSSSGVGRQSLWQGPARWLVALAVALGLAFTNHSMSYLLVPGLAILVLWPGRPATTSGRDANRFTVAPWKWVWRYAPVLLVAAIVPLLIYLYLPIRSSQLPLLNWGTPDNWRDFWRHVTLWEYKGYLAPQGTIGDYIGLAFSFAAQQLGPVLGFLALLLALVGLARLARDNRLLLVATAITWLATFFFTYSDQAAEIEAYSVPMYMMAFLWAGVGLYEALTWLTLRLAQTGGATSPGSRTRSRLAYIALGVPLLLGLAAFVWNAGRAGHRDDYTGEAYLRNHFNHFDQGAVVITDNWYIVSPTYYLQHVLGERKDVAVIDKNLLRYPFYLDYVDRQYADVLAPAKEAEAKYRQQESLWYNDPDKSYPELPQLYTDFIRAIITGNLGTRPVYLEWYTLDQEASAINQGFNLHPDGLALRVDQQPYSGPVPDPQFDLRGILTDPVPKDRVAHWVVDYYATALERMVSYARSTNNGAQADQLAALASQVRAALGIGQQ
jgi:hypothetical protein